MTEKRFQSEFEARARLGLFVETSFHLIGQLEAFRRMVRGQLGALVWGKKLGQLLDEVGFQQELLTFPALEAPSLSYRSRVCLNEDSISLSRCTGRQRSSAIASSAA